MSLLTCAHCGKTPSFECREHFVRTIRQLEDDLAALRAQSAAAVQLADAYIRYLDHGEYIALNDAEAPYRAARARSG